jgi:CRISPR/Cas system CSM-associated protein Csm3 (group 7 of RAMP superfamily)
MNWIEGGMLKKDGGKWFVQDGRNRYFLDHGIEVRNDLHNTALEEYALVTAGRDQKVVRLRLIDDDEEITLGIPVGTAPKGGGYKQDPKTQSAQDKAKFAKQREENDRWRIENPAYAPYNFVPLASTVVLVDDGPQIYSGYLEVDITAETPLFIRKHKDNPAFFQMNNGPFIPGSSMRGLTRSMVELLSFSAMREGLYSDKQFSFRSMADMGADLREAYKAVLPSNREDKDYLAGYLHYDNTSRRYYIRPAEYVRKFDSEKGPKDPEFEGKVCRVFSGKMQGKRHQWLIGPASPQADKRIWVAWEAERAYRDDATRHKDFNVLKKTGLQAYGDTGYPMFYHLRADGQADSIGHTAFYRIPYALKVSDHVPQDLPKQGEDFVQAIFGSTEVAGRVWFEDGRPSALPSRQPDAHTKLLLNPKPTSFQLYLQQPQGARTKLEDIRHWGNTDAPLRGHKLYWHRVTAPDSSPLGWKRELRPDEKNSKTYQHPIQPLPAGTRFQARIRFDRLRASELGALLFALNLPEDCRHKLGLGKPLGLGSIHIQARLHLLDRPARYQSLFGADGDWNTQVQAGAATDPFLTAFAHTIGHGLGQPIDSPEALWQEPRLKTVHTLLRFDRQLQSSENWLKATQYMENGAGGSSRDVAERYKKRSVLETPEEVERRFNKPPG